MTSKRTAPKTKPGTGLVDLFISTRQEQREARQLPQELRGRKLPRVSRALHNDHPLMRILAEWLRDPPAPADGKKRRTYTARSIETYLDIARIGVHFGDLTYPIRGAQTIGRYRNVIKVYRIIDAVVRRLREVSPGAAVDDELGILVSDLMARVREIPEPSGRGTSPKIRMTGDEWERFIEAAAAIESPAREAMIVLFTSGLRVNEWFNLDREKVREVGGGGKVVIIEKGDWRRVWEAAEEAQPVLLELAKHPRWSIVRDLFGDSYQQAYAKVRRIIDDLALDAGIRSYSIHKFRHAFAVRARKGASLDAVQQLLGHKVITTTKVYVEEAPPEERTAALNQAVPKGLIPERK